MTEERPVFVIGDVHGHVERLQALLVKADTDNIDCTVVQVGDLGHFGKDTMEGDSAAWNYAQEGWVDTVLWGNHDRAAVDPYHGFSGFTTPISDATTIMNEMERAGRLLMAYAAHGWLITHAGLHAQMKFTTVPEGVDKTNAASLAQWLNSAEARRLFNPKYGFSKRGTEKIPSNRAVVNAVGRYRGGSSSYGGILWRDINEKLWTKVPQIFGHSASSQHIVRGEAGKWYCIDIGGKGGHGYQEAECLAGIWLPSEEIVRVDSIKGEI